MAEKLAGKAAVVQVNAQDNPGVTSRFGVRGVPVIMMLKQGRVIEQLPGAQPLEAVLAWFPGSMADATARLQQSIDSLIWI
jgi:thioredoxin-like negative regulator of GroEL